MSDLEQHSGEADWVCDERVCEDTSVSPPDLIVYRISYKGFYYLDYSPSTGSLWVMDRDVCTLLDDKEIMVALAILTKVEGIMNKDILIDKLDGAKK